MIRAEAGVAELVLLGDSVIDNGTYVQPGQPDVTAQIQAALPGWQVTGRALDGSMVAHVTEGLAEQPLPAGARAVLSVGGNDALNAAGLLADPQEMTFAEAMIRLHGLRERFRAGYAALLTRLPVRSLVFTIYNPAFAGDEADLQVPAEGALSAFNDVIQQEALAAGHAILDLRRLFDDPADYANAIEPSAQGGAKIADRVADWVGA
ncbi:MAG: SGNH/GDSL hydrolase family protein [Pseudomonadota bacterium]